MKLVGYCRVSSKSQEDNTSLNSQEEEIRAFATYKKHELVEVLREAKSAKDTNRKQYQKMLDMLPEVDGLVVAKLDRLGRNVIHLLELVEKVLKPQNKALIILNLDIDTSTPQGMMILTMMAALAEMERSVMAERTSAGRRAAKAAGQYVGGGQNRYGFKHDAKQKRVVEEPKEQQQIARMVGWYEDEGLTCWQIADRMNAEGVPSKLNAKWDFSKVAAIFKGMGDARPWRKRKKPVPRVQAVEPRAYNLVNVDSRIKDAISSGMQQGLTQKEIADRLNEMGFVSIRGGTFDQSLVSRVRVVNGL